MREFHSRFNNLFNNRQLKVVLYWILWDLLKPNSNNHHKMLLTLLISNISSLHNSNKTCLEEWCWTISSLLNSSQTKWLSWTSNSNNSYLSSSNSSSNRWPLPNLKQTSSLSWVSSSRPLPNNSSNSSNHSSRHPRMPLGSCSHQATQPQHRAMTCSVDLVLMLHSSRQTCFRDWVLQHKPKLSSPTTCSKDLVKGECSSRPNHSSHQRNQRCGMIAHLSCLMSMLLRTTRSSNRRKICNHLMLKSMLWNSKTRIQMMPGPQPWETITVEEVSTNNSSLLLNSKMLQEGSSQTLTLQCYWIRWTLRWWNSSNFTKDNSKCWWCNNNSSNNSNSSNKCIQTWECLNSKWTQTCSTAWIRITSEALSD